MTIDIRFFDAVTKNVIGIDKNTGGFNFGVVRKGQESETKGIIIKNYGNETANGLSIKGSPLNSPTDIGIDATEYNRQLLAANWKYFSKFPNKNFTQTLTLPDIPAGGTLVGTKEIIDDFSDSSKSNWQQVTSSTTQSWAWVDGKLKMTIQANGSYGRVDAYKLDNCLNYDMTVKWSLVPGNNSTGATLAEVVLRAGGNTAGVVDSKGYVLVFKRNKSTTTTSDTIRCDMYHGEGVNLQAGSSLTNLTFTSQTINYIEGAPIRIKLVNNASGNPEITIWYNNISDTDTPWQWGNNAYSYIDTNKLYTKAGKTRICFGAASAPPATTVTFPCTFELDEVTLVTDDPEGKVYVKSIIGDGAEDSVVYKSSLELNYDPPTV